MYVNGKLIPDENFPEMGERGMKENGGGGEFKNKIFDIL
jgi:hypothetical protein